MSLEHDRIRWILRSILEMFKKLSGEDQSLLIELTELFEKRGWLLESEVEILEHMFATVDEKHRYAGGGDIRRVAPPRPTGMRECDESPEQAEKWHRFEARVGYTIVDTTKKDPDEALVVVVWNDRDLRDRILQSMRG